MVSCLPGPKCVRRLAHWNQIELQGSGAHRHRGSELSVDCLALSPSRAIVSPQQRDSLRHGHVSGGQGGSGAAPVDDAAP